jgi:hypothetical protein
MLPLRKYCWKLGSEWRWAVFVGAGVGATSEGKARTEEEAARQLQEAARLLEAAAGSAGAS